MIFAFSRDGALPGSNVWRKVNPKTKLPTNAVWLAAVAAYILALPYLWNSAAYAAVTSIAVIGLYIAYVIPSYLRLRAGDDFEPGPWNLGRWGKPVAAVSVVWVAIITVLFMLPQLSPVTAANFNYTPVAVLVVLGFAGIWWMVSARKWFTGPRRQGSIDDLLELEAKQGSS
jgi:amino acid transporter